MNQDPRTTPDDLQSVERSLDRLGALDGSAAPEGLESRIADASAPMLRAAPGAATPTILARIGPSRLRIAAAVMLVVGGAIVTSLALRPGRGPAPTPGSPTHQEPLASNTPASDESALLDAALSAVAEAIGDSTTLSSLSAEIDAFTVDPDSSLESIDLSSLEDTF